MATDFKLIIRATGIQYLLLPVSLFIGILAWKFGDHFIHYYMSALLIILSLLFNTQFTRTSNEPASYCALPVSKTILTISKNTISLCCVSGFSFLVLLIVAVFRDMAICHVQHASAIILFLSFLLLASGNIISVNSIVKCGSSVHPEMHFIQAAAVVISLMVYAILEHKFGFQQTTIVFLAFSMIGYIITFSRTCRNLENACCCLLEKQ